MTMVRCELVAVDLLEGSFFDKLSNLSSISLLNLGPHLRRDVLLRHVVCLLVDLEDLSCTEAGRARGRTAELVVDLEEMRTGSLSMLIFLVQGISDRCEHDVI